MAIPITVPRLGWSAEEGIFAGWLKEDGSTVRAGEALFALESDKANVDVECLDEGILRIAPDAPGQGDIVAVGVVIGYLVRPGEELPGGQPTPPKPRATASPRARRAARELGVDWTTLQGGGKTGRVRERDVRAATPNSTPAPTPAPATGSLTPTRRTIAARMLESHTTTAPVTLTTTVDATNLVNLREQFAAVATTGTILVPAFTDFLIKLTARALEQHPLLNAAWIDDRIVQPAGIHIGLAVDADVGLLVPVVRDVPALGLKEVATRTRTLIERARQHQLSSQEMQGGTFTITNLGAFGVESFTPLILPPQCAVLGVGRIARRPVVVGDAIVARHQLSLSLTFDHRIVDGAPAARFLQTLSALIENPGPALM
jgi:pyruvate dehydrogenase E2 component (dihydrolipoamide acetyltransferase)